jgi:hypothetical protein
MLDTVQRIESNRQRVTYFPKYYCVCACPNFCFSQLEAMMMRMMMVCARFLFFLGC